MNTKEYERFVSLAESLGVTVKHDAPKGKSAYACSALKVVHLNCESSYVVAMHELGHTQTTSGYEEGLIEHLWGEVMNGEQYPPFQFQREIDAWEWALERIPRLTLKDRKAIAFGLGSYIWTAHAEAGRFPWEIVVPWEDSYTPPANAAKVLNRVGPVTLAGTDDDMEWAAREAGAKDPEHIARALTACWHALRAAVK